MNLKKQHADDVFTTAADPRRRRIARCPMNVKLGVEVSPNPQPNIDKTDHSQMQGNESGLFNKAEFIHRRPRHWTASCP